jgi:hypothetical protein
MPPLLPELDELLAQIAGEMEMGPLSDEEKPRIEEIERIRVSTQRDFWSHAGAQAGPVIGTCTCGRPTRQSWRFCPFCGTQNTSGCSRCNSPLPEEEGVQFCPQCGRRASRPS